MKRLSVFLLFISFFIGMMVPVCAQAPYRHGIGATIGTTQAFYSELHV